MSGLGGVNYIDSLRRIYKITPITVNNISVVQVVIDPHFEKKHSASINDQLILNLVSQLDSWFKR